MLLLLLLLLNILPYAFLFVLTRQLIFKIKLIYR